ncbi:hypothetical protein NO2_0878 [Candidatus Termititenax persephonae]|uniref:Uncharacterized protein n=1 Tax=Candidatus Termititenax persephonae TaxID=2218525 RepID=A0A388TGQ6_9BACT|nr:hypothetical protein NO2_0878 [Candidatus Termititenax persephonae]
MFGVEKKDRFKLFLFLLAVIVSLGVFGYRLFAEQLNMKVELAYDYEDVLLLQAYTGQSQAQVLKMLQRAGVTSVVVPEDTLNNLTRRGLANLITGEQLLNMSRFGQIQNQQLLGLIRSSDITPENSYIMIDQVAAFQRAQNALINDLGAERAKVNGRNIIEVRGQVDNLGGIGLGLDETILANLSIYKFQIIPKLVNSRRLDDVSLGLKIDTVSALTPVHTFIFNGSEVLGYGNNLALVAEKMRKNGINYGVIEFFQQKGSLSLAEHLSGYNIGVHSIPAPQLQRLTKEQAIDRYVLAAMDRGMRILYLHAFVNDALATDLLAYNEEFISALKTRLERRGSTVTPIDQVTIGLDPLVSLIIGIIISLGIVSAGFLFLRIFNKNLPDGIFKWLLLGMLLLDIIFLRLNYFSQWRALLALLVSIIFPTLAMLTQLPKENSWQPDKMNFHKVLFLILRIVGITMLGALLIIGLLSDSYHLLKIYQFRGVKLAFGLPLLIVAFYYFMYPYRIKSLRFIIKRFLQSKVTVGYVLAGGAALAFFALYFLRSGNYQLPLFNGEAAMRNFLGYILLVRPRTKEFLLGYPLLVFICYHLGRAIDYRYKWVFYTLAAVAPVSLLNTFCHLHAPLWVSLLRSLNGLILGVAIGCFVSWGYKVAEKIWRYIF